MTDAERIAQLENDNRAYRELFDANPSALWSKLEAAYQQIAKLEAVAGGIAIMEEMHATPGKMEAIIREKPEMAQFIGQCFAAMIAKSKNYTEMKFEPQSVESSGYERITVLIQKGSGKTPHELRQEAEDKVVLLEAELKPLRKYQHWDKMVSQIPDDA